MATAMACSSLSTERQAARLFSNDDRVADPRGVAVDEEGELLFLNSGAIGYWRSTERQGGSRHGSIEGLNREAATSGRTAVVMLDCAARVRIMAFLVDLGAVGEHLLRPASSPFPRGFAFGRDGRLFLASGIGPNGPGDDSIVAFGPGGAIQRSWVVRDPELSPLDLAIALNYNIVVSSERPFGASMPSQPFANTTSLTDTLSASCLQAGGSARILQAAWPALRPRRHSLPCRTGRGCGFRFRDRRMPGSRCSVPPIKRPGDRVLPLTAGLSST